MTNREDADLVNLTERLSLALGAFWKDRVISPANDCYFSWPLKPGAEGEHHDCVFTASHDGPHECMWCDEESVDEPVTTRADRQAR